MTRTTTPRRTTGKKRQPRSEFSPPWLERYGRTLTGEEITLVEARRGLPPEVQTHLNAYASGIVVQLASEGRVKAALRALLDSPALQPDAVSLTEALAAGKRALARLRESEPQ